MATTFKTVLRQIDNGLIMEKDGKEIYYKDLTEFVTENMSCITEKALKIRKEILVSFEIDEVVRCKS